MAVFLLFLLLPVGLLWFLLASLQRQLFRERSRAHDELQQPASRFRNRSQRRNWRNQPQASPDGELDNKSPAQTGFNARLRRGPN